MKNPIPSITVLLLLASPASLWAVSEEQKAVDAIQERYESVHTITARFVQNSFVKLMNRTQKAEGTVQIKKPGKMKWVYKAPDPQILVSNGKVLWLYVPEDFQVTKVPVQSVYSSNTPALFLAGKGKLMETFDVIQVDRDENETSVVLVPKQEDSNLDRLILHVDNKNYQIIGSTVYDKLGNKTNIRFSEIQVNLDIPEQTFEFKIPEGVELLDYTVNP